MVERGRKKKGSQTDMVRRRIKTQTSELEGREKRVRKGYLKRKREGESEREAWSESERVKRGQPAVYP